MWVTSFWSVLQDLWCFFWRLQTPGNALVSTAHTHLVLPVRASQTLITLDTQTQSNVQLQADQFYTDESVETILIRQKLNEYDNRITQPGNLTLIEWLLYMVVLQNKTVTLLALRMSPVGLWHQTLKGLLSVRVEIKPSTGALMEWFDQDRVGQAGFIKRVSPDNTIVVCSVTSAPSGTFVEQRFAELDWKELGPVFTRFRQ